MASPSGLFGRSPRAKLMARVLDAAQIREKIEQLDREERARCLNSLSDILRRRATRNAFGFWQKEKPGDKRIAEEMSLWVDDVSLKLRED